MASHASIPGFGALTRTGRVRRAPDPARRRLLGATALVAFGSFLPWLHTPVGNVLGHQGPGLWTFYAAMLGFGGVLLPVALRRLAGLQALVLGLVAVGIPVWQLVKVFGLVGFAGWMPGPGIVMVLFGGVLALLTARPFLTTPPPEPAP